MGPSHSRDAAAKFIGEADVWRTVTDPLGVWRQDPSRWVLPGRVRAGQGALPVRLIRLPQIARSSTLGRRGRSGRSTAASSSNYIATGPPSNVQRIDRPARITVAGMLRTSHCLGLGFASAWQDKRSGAQFARRARGRPPTTHSGRAPTKDRTLAKSRGELGEKIMSGAIIGLIVVKAAFLTACIVGCGLRH